ncbi:MAG: TldD/PmbA family protein [Candidatus Heimdallarchaeota archaeon]
MVNQPQVDLEQLAQLTLSKTEELGMDDVITNANRVLSYQVRFANNQIVVTKRWSETSLNVFIVKNKRIIASELMDLEPEPLKASIENLAKFVRTMQPNEEYQGIAEGPFTYPTLKGLYDKSLVDLGENSIDLIETAINAALAEGAKRTAGVFLYSILDQYLTSNKSVEAKAQATSFEFRIRAFVDETASGQGLAVGRLLKTLDAEAVGIEAGQIAKLAAGGKTGIPGKYNAILHPAVAADIIAANAIAANPFAMEAGTSWLQNKVGTKIGSRVVSVTDDALVPNGLGSVLFDAEGHPTQKTLLIEKGTLKGVIHNTSTAQKAGTKSTGNAGLVSPTNHNVVFKPGAHSFEELLERACEGGTQAIYVTNCWYLRYTSMLDGTFSVIPRDGMFLVEKGEIARPIRELRISEQMLTMLRNVKAMENQTKQIRSWEVETSTFIPTVLVKDVTFSAGTT